MASHERSVSHARGRGLRAVCKCAFPWAAQMQDLAARRLLSKPGVTSSSPRNRHRCLRARRRPRRALDPTWEPFRPCESTCWVRVWSSWASSWWSSFRLRWQFTHGHARVELTGSDGASDGLSHSSGSGRPFARIRRMVAGIYGASHAHAASPRSVLNTHPKAPAGAQTSSHGVTVHTLASQRATELSPTHRSQNELAQGSPSLAQTQLGFPASRY